jgi:polar amino acid transport system permease protein
MKFDVAFAISILPTLSDGARITFIATCGGMALAVIGGLLLAVARMGSIRIVRYLASAYVEFVRDTPLLIQLFFLFYVLPYYGITLPALTVGIVGLGLNYSAYTAEVYRAGIESVPRGQWEVATALNLSPSDTWRHVVLPLAIPPVIPLLGNYLIGMFKDSMLLGTITVLELFGRTNEIGESTYRFLEPFTLLGVIVLSLSLTGEIVVRRLATRLDGIGSIAPRSTSRSEDGR